MTIGVIGSRGRLGSAIVALAGERRVAVGLERWRGGERRTAAPDVVLDVSHAAALADSAALARELGASLVVGTSGRGADDDALLAGLAGRLPVLVADNFSLGHFVQARIAALLARTSRLATAEIAVVDRHPVSKRDAPSGTARRLAHLLERAGGGAVRVESLRHGAPVSDHRIALTLDCETVTIDHEVSGLRAMASGALLAAAWAAGPIPPGRYTMEDVYAAA